MNMTPEQIAQRSEELFKQGFCCSESVLQAIAESRGIKSPLIPRMASGLCAGMARSGGTCGAVSGGVLAISVITGRNTAKDSREENYRLVRLFLKEFETKFGSNNCEKLIGCRLDTPEGQQYFKEHNLLEKCAGFTREAARVVSQLLNQSTAQGSPKV